MKQLTIVADDKVGLLADVSYLLGRARITIESISAVVSGGKAFFSIGVRDDTRVSQVLKANGYNVIAFDMLVVKLEDKPGELARVSKMLSDAGISIENVAILSKGEGMVFDCLQVDKTEKARKLLGTLLDLER